MTLAGSPIRRAGHAGVTDNASGRRFNASPGFLPGVSFRRDHRIEQAPAGRHALLLRRHKTEYPRLSHTGYALFQLAGHKTGKREL